MAPQTTAQLVFIASLVALLPSCWCKEVVLQKAVSEAASRQVNQREKKW